MESLLYEDEKTAIFGHTGSCFQYECIIPKSYRDGDDIAACLEETLHRILDNKGAATDILRILGAEKTDCPDLETQTHIDLGYVIPGQLVYFYPRKEEDSEPHTTVDTRMRQ